MIQKDNRDTVFKIQLFRKRFSGLEHIYGTYDPVSGRSWQEKKPVTDDVILRHLTGKQPYGVYLLTRTRTRAVVADFDHDDPVPPMEFSVSAGHYGLACYLETSKSKGYHTWMFFGEDGVSAAKARAVFRHILEEMGHADTEVFPKQDAIDPDSGSCGNFINAPLYGSAVHQGRTVFIDPNASLKPYPNQWEFLDNVESVPESALDEMIEVNDIVVGKPTLTENPITLGVFRSPYRLPPCIVCMLEAGVTANQRTACFWLAVQLRKVGLPYDLTVSLLTEWARKNRPTEGKTTITGTEVKSQASSAYFREYRGYGCETPAVKPFCRSSCPIYEVRGLMPRDSGPGGEMPGSESA